MSNKHYDYCFTINNPEPEDVYRLPDARYLVYGFEIGEETGTPHYQGYVYFQNPRSFDSVRKLFAPHHIKPRYDYSTPEAAAVYCKKDKDYIEIGECPITNQSKGELEKQRWARARRAAESDRFEEIDDQIYVTHFRNIIGIRNHSRPASLDLETRETYGKWIYGPTCSGKSHLSRSYTPYYLKDKNKWWDNYNGEKYVIIDEVCPDDKSWITQFLKKWVDKWTFSAEFKTGTFKPIRPYEIIVTSNYSLEEVFGTGPDYEALKRRFEVIYMPYKY